MNTFYMQFRNDYLPILFLLHRLPAGLGLAKPPPPGLPTFTLGPNIENAESGKLPFESLDLTEAADSEALETIDEVVDCLPGIGRGR